MHVGGGRDDLGGAHLLHALQRLLSLGCVQVRVGTLAGDLQCFQSDLTQFCNNISWSHNTKSGQGTQRIVAGFKGIRFESVL